MLERNNNYFQIKLRPKLSHQLSLLSLYLFSVFTHANNSAHDQLYELTLAELMEVQVTTASKFEESVEQSHASITVINEWQIQQFGAHNLYELLERIVSVNSNFGVLTSITTRGSRPWTSLLQHLGLINGRPFGNLSGVHNLYTSVPISSIERIEYVRGPGSVLYGTNAYHGVFNIITKKAQTNGWQINQAITMGSFDTQIVDGSYQFKHDDLLVGASFLYTDVKGWDAETFDPFTQEFYHREAFQKEQTVHFEASYKNLSLSHYHNQQERFANYWDAAEANYIPWSKLHPINVTNISYQHPVDDTLKVEGHFTLIKKTMEWSSQGIADDIVRIRSPFKIRLFELNLFKQITAQTTLLTGATFENRKIYDASTIPDASEDFASLYFQYQHQVNAKLSYLLGGQWVRSLNLWADADNQSQFVPRIGLSYEFIDNWTVKARIGEAYRHPTAGERSIETPGIQKGSPDLQAESITTKELQLFYQAQDKYFSLVYYKSKEDNLITLVPTNDPTFPLQNKNIGKITSEGVELEFNYKISSHWYTELSSYWQTNKDENHISNINLAPNYGWKLGVGYQSESWRVGLYNLHYANYHDTKLFDASTELVNPQAKGYDWLSLKLTRQIKGATENGQLLLSLEIKNILDEHVYQPNDTPVFYPINTLPAREGRAAYLTLSYRL
ncbi:TonB-dependent receptor plug domain-containing protein [Thalassotalea ganghwensis]